MSAAGPLSGIRVLDLSRALSGPYAGRLLADLGAEVVKLEPPEGDEARLIAPRHDRDMSALLTFANVGKQGLCLDLRREGAAAVVLDLVAAADVVIENFRPGVLERLSLGWEALCARNPRVVLLSVNGFGSDTEAASRRAYAPVVQAEAGLVADQAAAAGTPPVPFREHFGDTMASLHGALGVLAALRVAERTGRGQHVEVPMLDALLSTSAEALNALLPEPDDRVMNPILDAGTNGRIATTGAVQHLWVRVRQVAPELRDPAPPDADHGTKGRLRLAALERWAASLPTREAVLARLDEAGIGAGPVVSMAEALAGPLVRGRGLLVPVDDRRGGTRCVVRPPIRLSESRCAIAGPAPRRGEHGREVLSRWAGYDAERLRRLELDGILLAPDGHAEPPAGRR